MRLFSRISRYVNRSIMRKLIFFNSLIILLVFVTAFFILANVNSRMSLEREQSTMRSYLGSTLEQVDNYYKDMSRVSMVAFADSTTQSIMQNASGYTIEQKLESITYLHNLFLSILSIREDIGGIFLFDNEDLLYSYDSSFQVRPGFQVQDYPQYFEQSEASYDSANSCYVLTGPLPGFLRRSDYYATTFQSNYLIMVREVHSFQPNERIGYIMLLSPVATIHERLSSLAEPDAEFLLTDSHGTIICDSHGAMISVPLSEYDQLLEERRPSRGESAYYHYTLDGQAYYVSAETSEYNGFTLFIARPESVIYRDSSRILGLIIAIALAALAVSVAGMTAVVRRTIRPIVSLSNTMSRVTKGNTHISEEVVSEDETSWLTRSFNEMMDTINDLILSEYEATIKLQQAELAQKETQLLYLLGQINPHFLYNTLDTIRIKAAINGDGEVSQMIMQLVDFFRRSLGTSESFVTVGQELKLVHAYLGIMKYRYPTLQDEYHCQASLEDCRIPSFVLQPLVENSLMHGLKSVGYQGKVQLFVERHPQIAGDIRIRIADNGVGMEPERLTKLQQALDRCEPLESGAPHDRHIGVVNVQRRLRMHYPEPYGLSYKNNPAGGVTATIRLPDSTLSPSNLPTDERS